jgi:hypothetical protein
LPDRRVVVFLVIPAKIQRLCYSRAFVSPLAFIKQEPGHWIRAFTGMTGKSKAAPNGRKIEAA